MTANTNDHTPGPWKVEADPDNKGKHPYHDTRFITTGDGGNWQWIAKLSDHPNQAANARLIAACPDLIAALEKACYLIDSGYLRDPDWESLDWEQKMQSKQTLFYDAARAAIEKARTGRMT